MVMQLCNTLTRNVDRASCEAAHPTPSDETAHESVGSSVCSLADIT